MSRSGSTSSIAPITCGSTVSAATVQLGVQGAEPLGPQPDLLAATPRPTRRAPVARRPRLSAATSRSRVDLPTPGSPPEQGDRPGTRPPSSTRVEPVDPRRSGRELGGSTSAIGCAEAGSATARRRAAPAALDLLDERAPLGSRGHCPTHLGAVAHTSSSGTGSGRLAMATPYPRVLTDRTDVPYVLARSPPAASLCSCTVGGAEPQETVPVQVSGRVGSVRAMAYDEDLADLLRAITSDLSGVSWKRMFGGLAFLLDGHMTVVASGRDGMMVRVPTTTPRLCSPNPTPAPMVMRDKEMKGWPHRPRRLHHRGRGAALGRPGRRLRPHLPEVAPASVRCR